jgi:hypothetical protein
MPVHLIGTAPGGGAAGIAASQTVGLAAFRAAMPMILLEVSADPSRSAGRARLLPALRVRNLEAASVLSEIASCVTVVAAVEAATATTLAPILPLADTVLVTGTHLGNDLKHAACLYRELSALRVCGRFGRVIEPWLVPAGWACTQVPGIRLRRWQRRLADVAGQQPLRCLPLVFPWMETGSLKMAKGDRLDTVGSSLLQHLSRLAAGRKPNRPLKGLAGGDPWPDHPDGSDAPTASVIRPSQFRARPRLVQGEPVL